MRDFKNYKKHISMRRHFSSAIREFKRKGVKQSDLPECFLKVHDTCVVLGNGPSLKIDIEYVDRNSDVIAVNHFSESRYFTDIKPGKYILIDSYFWDENTHDSLVIKRDKLFEDLNLLVTWDMQLILPSFADVKFIENKIMNSKVSVKTLKAIPSNITNIKYGPIALSTGMVAPPAVNVLIFAIYTAILCEYSNIEVLGADMSFHNDVQVDQVTNQLYMEYKHFYGENEKLPLMENPEKVKPFNMTDLMRLTHLTFYSHQLLNRWAELKGISIVNRSSYSMIDAYPRKKFDEK